ncbi:MAG: quinolinate synthase NadA [Thermoplasmatales archaeon]|nr:quinolinate synthase NadA [Thermoplasmatales archaeon]
MEGTVGRIRALKEKRNAVILAHNYVAGDVQDIADHVGDSLGLSVAASETDADVIVFCGVTFMGETAKILNPGKTVLMPEPEARCPMADMCSAESIRAAKLEHPGAAVIGYVNTNAESKTEMDVCCTSSNAVGVASATEAGKIIFLPDANLGRYVSENVPDKEIVLWEGYCPVHQSISPDDVSRLAASNPGAVVMAHPECTAGVLALADYIGSTEGMVGFAKASDAKTFVVATEVGMGHRLELECPGKDFVFPPNSVCEAMKITTLESVEKCLEGMTGEIRLPKDVMDRARVPLERMLGTPNPV